MGKYGIEEVAKGDRNSNWLDMLMIWSGNSFCIPSFIIGAMLIPTYGWYEALSINLLGNLVVGVLIVLGGYFGIKTGLPSVMYGKFVFGERFGQIIPTACLIISTLGWFAIITTLTGQAVNNIIKAQYNYSNPTLFIVLCGIATTYIAMMGYKKIRRLSWITVPVLFLISLWFLVYYWGLSSTTDIDVKGTGSASFWVGIDIVVGGYIAGALAASDFSRYTNNYKDNWFGVLPGTFLISFFLGWIGMIATALTGYWNPVQQVQYIGLGIPALLFLFMANWTTNFNLLYSSGLAVTSLIHFKRWVNTLFCGALGTALAVMGIEQYLQDMLTTFSLLISPVVAVLLTHFFIVKGHIQFEATNYSAVLAVLIGISSTFFIPDFVGVTIPSFLCSSISYLVLYKVIKRSFYSNISNYKD